MATTQPGGLYTTADGDLVDANGKPAEKLSESPSEYGAMDKADLEALATERGLTVAGTGKGGAVLKGDLVAALSA